MKQDKPPPAPVDRGVDGGTAALSGFLYQMLGCAAIYAAACQEPRTTGSEYEALITLARTRDIHQEEFGQDGVLKPLADAVDQGTVLVQFKYSGAGTLKPVQPGELETIAKQMAKAAGRVKANGGKVAACYLVTNRQLGPGAGKSLVPAARTSRPSKGVRDKLGGMRVIPEVSAGKWIGELKLFAARYGLFQPEIEDGVGKIVARLFQQGAGFLASHPIRRADLVEAFTGSAAANPLERAGLGTQMQREVQRLHPGKGGKLVRREILDRVEREAPNRALIVFAGRGGMGKTASLHAWASELSAVGTGPVRPLVAATTTRDLPENWPDRLLSEWRNLHASGREKIRFDRIVERLRIANPSLAAPLLHVCLDGLDEHADNHPLKGTVGRLLRWFLDEDRTHRKEKITPVVRLVVTCRDKSQLAREWLDGSSGFSGDEEDSPPAFDFDQFSEREFAALVRDNVPSLQNRLLARAAALPSRSLMMTQSLEDTPMNTFGLAARPASDELIDVLRDPAMWRSFLELGPADQEAIVNNDRKARLRMGARFIERFCAKLASRTHLAKEDVLPTLQSIAAAYQGHGDRYLTNNEWKAAAQAPGILEPTQATRLLDEARSGGLVDDKDKRQWQWRNTIIEDALLFSPDLT